MIDIKFEPPKASGSTEQRLAQLEAWARIVCEKLNVILDTVVKEKDK